MFLPAHKLSKLFSVSASTLRRWHRQKKIEAVKTPTGLRLYNISNIVSCKDAVSSISSASSSCTSVEQQKQSYVYARVSSQKQKADLERQKQYLCNQFPTHQLVSDIGSGINFKRPGLRSLLERSSCGMVQEVVVTHRDRLCRFAFDLIEFIFKLHGTKILVLSDDQTTDEYELSQDILAINTVFICRMQGRRAAKYRRERLLRQEAQTKNNVSSSKATKKGRRNKSSQDTHLSECFSKDLDETMDGLC
jgi:putative resolvase